MGKSHVSGWASDSPTPAQMKEFFAQIDNGRVTKDRLQKFLRGGEESADDFKPSVSYLRAREIMGRNVFGPEDAKKHFGVKITRADVFALAEIPWSDATLESCRETHILVAVFPLSILDIRNKVHGGRRLFYDQSWYDKESFAKDKGDVSWKLVRKTPVANSTSKTWSEQQALLGKNEETPTARMVVYTTIGHFLVTGERLFEKIYVRCSDVTSGGARVGVGYFDEDGLNVGNYWGDAPAASSSVLPLLGSSEP